ncbi:Response regulator [Salipiger mucosus DSM 16094]|uniref:Response regulator n=1 Tax=Salipiger mucosus DSM 16094 TaxID=1123237 RepID=S9QX98_9RHOB|nr:Response regulator [Salipiger mucosus DSM 16094]
MAVAGGAIAVIDARPDLVIVDPNQESALEDFVAQVGEACPEARFVACASNPSLELARFCMELDFRGFLPKSLSREAMIRALAVIVAGGSYVDRQFGRRLMRPGGGRSPLSRREETVLRRMSEGSSAAEIADGLGISFKTVDTHRVRAMTKLDLADRRALVRHALARGWLA